MVYDYLGKIKACMCVDLKNCFKMFWGEEGWLFFGSNKGYARKCLRESAVDIK